MANLFDNPELYSYVVLPILIFFARICDVTIGTLRIIFVSKGQKNIAPFLGFFEVFIWIVAISQIMKGASNIYCYLGYAAGFATGNYVGMLVEERLAVGNLLVRIITTKDGVKLVKLLSSKGHGATSFSAEGSMGNVNIVYSVVNRKNMGEIQQILNDYDPKLFYTLEDIRKVNAGIFPEKMASSLSPLMRWRKGK
ncbi:MAG: DUF2179 domain-containing protein [Bacteroidales bacterium]|nr:MAG: DUF2179 domain-containing protein [Bacteroidales bacterium]